MQQINTMCTSNILVNINHQKTNKR